MLKLDGVAYLPAEAAAEAIGTTHMKVLMLLREQRLSGELIDGSWYVTEESVEGYYPGAAEPRVTGCRSSCTSSRCGCH